MRLKIGIPSKCEYCGKDFLKLRKDSRFCSHKCRIAYWREKVGKKYLRNQEKLLREKNRDKINKRVRLWQEECRKLWATEATLNIKDRRKYGMEIEVLGFEILKNLNFDFLYRFGEHRRAKLGNGKHLIGEKINDSGFRTGFPFDVYAEKNGECWFIDVTASSEKYLDDNLVTIFRRTGFKFGVLFISEKLSYFDLKELPKTQKTLCIGIKEMREIIHSQT